MVGTESVCSNIVGEALDVVRRRPPRRPGVVADSHVVPFFVLRGMQNNRNGAMRQLAQHHRSSTSEAEELQSSTLP